MMKIHSTPIQEFLFSPTTLVYFVLFALFFFALLFSFCFTLFTTQKKKKMPHLVVNCTFNPPVIKLMGSTLREVCIISIFFFSCSPIQCNAIMTKKKPLRKLYHHPFLSFQPFFLFPHFQLLFSPTLTPFPFFRRLCISWTNACPQSPRHPSHRRRSSRSSSTSRTHPTGTPTLVSTTVISWDVR